MKSPETKQTEMTELTVIEIEHVGGACLVALIILLFREYKFWTSVV